MAIGWKLTSSALVDPIQGDDITFLREGNQGKQDVELIPGEGDISAVPTRRSKDSHDTGLLLGAKLGGSERPRDAPRCDATIIAIIENHGIESGDIALGDLGRWEEVADGVGTALLFARCREVPRRTRRTVVICEECARRGFGHGRLVFKEG